MKLDDVLAYHKGDVECTSAPIGICLPGQEGDLLAAKVIDSGAPFPTRRRVAIPVAKGTGKVALEIWEGKDEVKVEKVEREKIEDDEDEDDEEEEDEETKTPITKRTQLLGGLELTVKDRSEVLLEIIVQKGSFSARLWEEGRELSLIHI